HPSAPFLPYTTLFRSFMQVESNGNTSPNPTNAVGGLFILSRQKERPNTSPNPTNAVGGLFILSLQKQVAERLPNPTNAVGGLFILSLQKQPAEHLPESHQRSWWIVHIQPNCSRHFINCLRTGRV